MAQIATVTIGTDTFSVYALTSNALTDANSFWNVRLGSERTAWEAATDDDKKRALVVASDWIDRASTFTGSKTSASQPREWPRDSATCDGTAITDGTTPDGLAYATFWLAGAALVNSDAAASEGTGSNVKSAKAGSAKVEFFSSTVDDGTRLPITAHDYIKCMLEGGASILGGTDSGTSDDSAFDEDDFDRTSPWA